MSPSHPEAAEAMEGVAEAQEEVGGKRIQPATQLKGRATTKATNLTKDAVDKAKKLLKLPWDSFDGFQMSVRSDKKRDALKIVAKSTEFNERTAGDDFLKLLFTDKMLMSIHTNE